MKVDRAWLKANVTIALAKAYEDSIDWRREYKGDQQLLDWIQSQLDAGNEWAWCEVTVRVTWGDFVREEHMGACSYESERAFREGGYYDDMVETCVDSIADVVDALADIHDLWEHERRSCITCLAEASA